MINRRINISNECLNSILNSKRLPVLFIGSGISKRYLKNAPTWNELLKDCYQIFDSSGIQYSQSLDQCRRDKLSSFQTFQYLGTKAEEFYNEYYFKKLRENPTKTPSWIKEVSPFKMHLSERFKKMVLKPNGYLQKEMRLLKQLNEKPLPVILFEAVLVMLNFCSLKFISLNFKALISPLLCPVQ